VRHTVTSKYTDTDYTSNPMITVLAMTL